MAIIPGIQICITPPKRGARGIITKMVLLLEIRRRGTISRRRFLERWEGLRKALFLTPEYRDFRRRVLERCEGVCELCNDAPAVHVHHTKPVSFFPRLALVVPLAKGTCVACHEKEHEL